MPISTESSARRRDSLVSASSLERKTHRSPSLGRFEPESTTVGGGRE
ncbi:hypothetical protein [Haladaptatus sp. R4]|nr:hypothetical protein [Haladaptatus sp. R4]